MKKSLQLRSENQKQAWLVQIFFFTYACVTHSIVRDWLCYSVTKTKILGTKKHSSKWRNMYREMKKEITSKKKQKLIKVKQITWQCRKWDLHFFILLILNRFLSADLFHLFFRFLIIDHKHKCIQAKTFETQVTWNLDSCTH